MEVFIMRPNITLYPGVRVTKDTVLEYKNEKVEQKVENLVLHSVVRAKGEQFEGVYDTTIYLEEGDILAFEDEGRGYIKPAEALVTVEEAIADLENIKDLGEAHV
jgi:hypothetical protein